MTKQIARLLAGLSILLGVAGLIMTAALAQNADHAAPGGDALGTLKAKGGTLFTAKCASCHEPAVGRAPTHAQLGEMSVGQIYAALTTGPMKPMAAGLSAQDLAALTVYLGKVSGQETASAADPPPCPASRFTGLSKGDWNGWGDGLRNSRFQPDPGLAAASVSRLKVKWAFTYAGGIYGQPTVVGGRLFLTSMFTATVGAAYSLDAKTGCMYWKYASVPSRTTVSVGPLPGVAPSGYAAYFADFSHAYAVDAGSGALLWKTQVETHPKVRLTGSPVLFRGRLYVPVSSYEEAVTGQGAYPCCTFRGSVVALDAATGKVIWKTYAIQRAPAPTTKNSAGTQMYGPSGAAVWSAPTIDAKRNWLYFTTGDSYTDTLEGGSDAVIAVDLANGRIVWRRQVTKNDNYQSGCEMRPTLANCPTKLGHDYDFGASAILMSLPNGKDIVLAGQKSGAVYGLDPDHGGRIVWKTQVGAGGGLGGIEWGMATDGRRLFVSNADVTLRTVGAGPGARPGLYVLNPADGKVIWSAPTPKVACGWTGGTQCENVQSAPPSAIAGVVFAGSMDGHLRAYTAATGKLLWDFDTAGQTYDTVNGVKHQSGGSLDATGPTVSHGMVFVMSGYRSNLGGVTNNVLLAFSKDAP